MAERLDDRAVVARLAELEDTLERLERMPGPSSATGLDAVAMLAEVYGEALARIMERLPADSPVTAALAADELLRHLLALHDIHPQPLEERLRRALSDLAPVLMARGARAELATVDGGVARVRMSGGCASSAGPLREAVEQALLAIAPELDAVEVTRDTFVPTDTLFTRPSS